MQIGKEEVNRLPFADIRKKQEAIEGIVERDVSLHFW